MNGRGAMYYTGGEDGMYMRISKDGTLDAGMYEGAVPHIGDAVFRSAVMWRFDSYSKAFTAAMEVGGKRFLTDMFSGSNHQPLIKITGAPEEKRSTLAQLRAAKTELMPPRGEKLTERREHKSDMEH